MALLHREDYYHAADDDYDSSHTAELIVAKQRNGPTDTVKLSWNERCTRFRDYSPAVAPVEYAHAYEETVDVGDIPI